MGKRNGLQVLTMKGKKIAVKYSYGYAINVIKILIEI